jgi:raffinose/stachyose/melibiose transport system permease protein
VIVTQRPAPTPAQQRPRGRRPAGAARGGAVARYAGVAVILLVYLGPLLLLLNTALKTSAQFSTDPSGLTHSVALSNFSAAWSEGGFSTLILNSLLYTGVCATASTVLSLMIAFPVARGYIRWPQFWLGLFVVALFLPNALTTQFQLLLHLGLYNSRIGYMLLLTAPLGVGPLLITGYVRSIPRELDEAAAIDGAGYFRYLFQFVLPLCRPVLVTAFILQAINVWNEIILATILLPDPGKLPVNAGLFAFYGQYTDEWPLLAAATLIVAFPLIVIYLLIQRQLVAGAMRGAFKG